MVVVGRSMGHEEKLTCSGIVKLGFEITNRYREARVRNYQSVSEVGRFQGWCLLCRLGKCSWKCLKFVFSAGVRFSGYNETVETVEKSESLMTAITGKNRRNYRSLNRVKFVQDVRNTVSRDGGLSLLPEVLAARVFEALRILTETAVFFTGSKRARILSINFTQKYDNPPC